MAYAAVIGSRVVDTYPTEDEALVADCVHDRGLVAHVPCPTGLHDIMPYKNGYTIRIPDDIKDVEWFLTLYNEEHFYDNPDLPAPLYWAPW